MKFWVKLICVIFLGLMQISVSSCNENRVKIKTMVTSYIDVKGNEIAYREFGKGQALLLCNRFRGTLDTWDPLFIESLAKQFRVIVFDYPDIGYSSGKFPDDIDGLANIVEELCNKLNLNKVALGGWSFGGYVAQTFALQNPNMVSQLILIGTNPPGENAISFEPIFLEKALVPVNSEEDEVVLFFEPKSESSVQASKASHKRIYENIDVGKIPSTQEKFNLYFQAGKSFKEDASGLREKLISTSMPILIIHGDHDVSFAVENWFSFLRQLKNGQLIIYTLSGHGPQHQFPKLTAEYIASFVVDTNKKQE